MPGGGYLIRGLIAKNNSVSLYSGLSKKGNKPLVIKIFNTSESEPADIASFKQTMLSIKSLKAKNIVRIVDVEEVDDGIAIATERFEGAPLSDRPLGPQDIKKFLNVAARMARALDCLHKEDIIHGDIRPASIAVNTKSDEAKITAFGAELLITREDRDIHNPKVIREILPYISPERTGRMNRTADHRSDLYSLGVVFYEILTGSPPFMSDDPLDIYHKHIASTPPHPFELNYAVPGMVSSIVMRLLNKAPEDRYQSAAGLLADIEGCLKRLDKRGRIEDFTLFEKDVPPRLTISEKLYGREGEIETLMSIFSEVSHGDSCFTLISGYSGVGKSALANCIRRPVQESKGFFISGKFDQLNLVKPYSAIMQAFSDLARQILSESEAEIREWKDRLLAALGANGRIITDMIPEIELIIGSQPDVPEVGPTESMNRFILLFQKFIRVFACKERPLVMLLDDLQWADAASLKLIEKLIADPEASHILIIGAFRDNEVDESHPLSNTLGRLENEEKATVYKIPLRPLTAKNLNQMIADTLCIDSCKCEELSGLVYRKTEGNPFFTRQFLKDIERGGIIRYDPVFGWAWEEDEIHKSQKTENVTEMLARRVTNLSPMTLDELKLASCIGARFDLETISLVSGAPVEQVYSAVAEAVHDGFITHDGGVYGFSHDRIQEAAYSLVDHENRKRAHLKIGRLLLGNAGENLDGKIFEIANHLNAASDLIDDTDEKLRLAELNLKACVKAKKETAFRAARGYASTGALLLGGKDDQYTLLAFSLRKELLECHYLCGDTEAVEGLFKELLGGNITKEQKAELQFCRLKQLTAVSDFAGAMGAGIEALRQLGIDIPSSREEMRRQVALLAKEITTFLNNKDIEDLVNTPWAATKDQETTVSYLVHLCRPAFSADFDIFALSVLKAASLSLSKGVCHQSANAFGISGFVFTIFGDIPTAVKVADLGFRLNEKHYDETIFQSIQFLYNGGIRLNVDHIKDCVDGLESAVNGLVNIGDFLHAGYATGWNLSQLFLYCPPLSEQVERADKLHERMLKTKQAYFANHASFFKRMAKRLQSHKTLKDALNADDHEDMTHLEESTLGNVVQGVFHHFVYKGYVNYLFGNCKDADSLFDEAEKIIDPNRAMPSFYEFTFYRTLLDILMISKFEDQPDKRAERAGTNIAFMKSMAGRCPENFLHKYLLMSAEMARGKGEKAAAMDLYDEAIKAAGANGFMQNEALANELAAKFHSQTGREKVAAAYMTEARRCYSKWGAGAKVADLDRKYPHLLAGSRVSGPVSLDMASVMKASLAISEETSFSALLGKLLKIIMENAGAGQGVLVLEKNGELFIEAEGLEAGDDIRVLQSMPMISDKEAPAGIINYVARTRKPVILYDASASREFNSDPYVSENRPKSVLCAPLLKQAELVGIIYLENNLAAGVFTDDRVETIRLLASQAAISIENAKLFEGLEEEIAERKRAEEITKQSEDRLRKAQEVGQIGVWDWDMVNNITVWSPEAYKIFGVTPDTFTPGFDAFMAFLHPDDRLMIQSLHEKIEKGLSQVEFEIRITRPDGAERVITNMLEAFYDENGAPVRMTGINQDITERKRVEEMLKQSHQKLEKLVGERTAKLELTIKELEKAKIEAEKATRLKDRLMSLVAHDLKSPLTSAAGLLNRAFSDLEEMKGDENVTLSVLRAHEKISYLLELVEKLLNAGRIRGGELKLERKHYPAKAIVDYFISPLKRAAESKGIIIANEAPLNAQVFVDMDLFGQVIQNLVSNAIKFTERGGMIKIFSPENSSGIAVEDTGVGLSQDDLSRIFKCDERLTKPGTMGEKGFGLGLSLCREIVEAHGGSLKAESSHGKGSVFYVYLPEGRAEA